MRERELLVHRLSDSKLAVFRVTSETGNTTVVNFEVDRVALRCGRRHCPPKWNAGKEKDEATARRNRIC